MIGGQAHDADDESAGERGHARREPERVFHERDEHRHPEEPVHDRRHRRHELDDGLHDVLEPARRRTPR